MVTGLLLFIIAFISGAYGIIVGAGGGFIFVPVLLIFFNMSPSIAAGTGLVVVMLNSISGAIGYVKQKRIDYKQGLLISAGATPGTFIGVWLGQYSSPQIFYVTFSIVTLLLGFFLLLKKDSGQIKSTAKGEVAVTLEEETTEVGKSKYYKVYSLLLVGVILGSISSYLGIGGGWLLVPILIYLFRVSPHYATATSIYSLCIYSTIGVITQIYHNNIDWVVVLWGGLGVIVGAQAGVFLSNKISGNLIIKLLSLLLIGTGVQLFISK